MLFRSISLSSSTKELFKLGINSLLNYSALKLAKDRGYKYVDRGSDSNLYGHYLNPGLYIFKKSFGFRVAPKKKYGFAWTKIKNFSKLSDPMFFISMGKNGLEGNIFFKEILPNALSPIVAMSSLMVASSILLESAVSFLGLGDPNLMTWGYMIGTGRTVIRGAWWMSVLPGVALVSTILIINVVGEGLDPKSTPLKPHH